MFVDSVALVKLGDQCWVAAEWVSGVLASMPPARPARLLVVGLDCDWKPTKDLARSDWIRPASMWLTGIFFHDRV